MSMSVCLFISLSVSTQTDKLLNILYDFFQHFFMSIISQADFESNWMKLTG